MAPVGSSPSSSRCASRNCVYASAIFSGGVVAAGRVWRTNAARKSAIGIRLNYSPTMAVDPELLEILACPNCKTPVTLVKNGTALKCATCKRVYPIKDDIPVMLIDEATIEE